MTIPPVSRVIVSNPNSVVRVDEPEQVVVRMATSGPQGPPGPTGPPGSQPIFTRAGWLEIDEGVSRYYSDCEVTLTRARASVSTPPIGQSVLVTINLDQIPIGVVEIEAGEFTGVLDMDVPFNIGHFLTVDITQTGTTVSGRDLTVAITTN